MTKILKWMGLGTRPEVVLYESTQPTLAKALEEAVEKGVDLTDALLEGDLRGLRLENQRGARLAGARFDRCDLSGTSLRFARLHTATFTDCVLRGTNLRYADLSQADMHRVDFTGAETAQWQILGATFAEVKVHRDQLAAMNHPEVVAEDLHQVLRQAPLQARYLLYLFRRGQFDGGLAVIAGGKWRRRTWQNGLGPAGDLEGSLLDAGASSQVEAQHPMRPIDCFLRGVRPTDGPKSPFLQLAATWVQSFLRQQTGDTKLTRWWKIVGTPMTTKVFPAWRRRLPARLVANYLPTREVTEHLLREAKKYGHHGDYKIVKVRLVPRKTKKGKRGTNGG